MCEKEPEPHKKFDANDPDAAEKPKYIFNENEAKRYEQDTEYRKILTIWVIIAVSVWLFLTIATIALNNCLNLGISDVVCCTLLGTTTINVIGLAYIVLKGLFEPPPKTNH